MNMSYQTIQTKHILCAGRWMLALFAPLASLATRQAFTPVTWAAESLFVVSAVLFSLASVADMDAAGSCMPRRSTATSRMSRESPGTHAASRGPGGEVAASCAILFAGVDILLVTAIGTWIGAAHAMVWLLYLWCVIETTLSLRSKVGFLAVISVDALSLIYIVPWWPWSESIPMWLLQLLLFNFSALPLLFLAYWEARQRHTLENRVAELSEQVARTQELETINRQMTDYAMDVQNRAVIDQLTGLFNQTHFHHRLIIEFEKARQADRPLSLIIVDIDHFKRFNDQFGHYLGDDVLRAVGHVLLDFVTGRFWVAGRIGGEEMAVLMPEIPLDEAAAWAERLRSSIADTIVPGPVGPLRVTVSVGVAGWPGPAADAAELTKYADRAMYAAKDGGRNRVCLSGAR